MADLISLICPSCGGKLQVARNATSLICDHCGNEHLVKHEAGAITLEAYARCPQCGRNDKCEKVTSVINSQSHDISGTEQKNEVVLDMQGLQRVVSRNVPFTRKQVSVLGQRLAPPVEPQFGPGLNAQGFSPTGGASPTGGILLIVAGVISLAVAACAGLTALTGLFNLSSSQSSDFIITGLAITCGLLFLLFLGAAGIGLGIYLITRSAKTKRSQLDGYNQMVKAEMDDRERIKNIWKNAIKRWNQLYYCARDDCVFIPGENSSAPLSGMQEYLSK